MKNEIPEHSLLKSIFLHLLPGLLAGACYFILAPHVKSLGFPSVMAMILSGIIIMIPFELGFLIYQKRLTGQMLFNGVIQYCKKIPTWQYFVLVPAIFLLSGLLFKAFGFTSDFLRPLFDWIPPDFIFDMGLEKDFSKSTLVITYSSFLILVVLVVPTIEEFYFRGFLLPRMPSRLKGWTEIVHSGLFALYHTWTPWMFIIRTVGVLPLIYAVKRKQNIYIGIIAHCLLNSVDFFIGLKFILSL
ncbi:MAG: CPBP family intramembrane metalloprotease [Bacteroidales bacterium]|nr:CPBP family intramembrane metalloprotease [Bacteroidales bacterium]